jgi:hypothetical protein
VTLPDQARPIDRGRLVKLLGMLGSDHEGERVNAGMLADRLVRDAGITWAEIVNGSDIAIQAVRRLLAENDELRAELAQLRAVAIIPSAQPWRDADDADDAIEALLLWRAHLNEWEQGFLSSLLRRRRRLTEKQYAALARIGLKVDSILRAGIGGES